ncbi:MAG: GNAT family N-acetyltransferase [Planctomycetota bacterium]
MSTGSPPFTILSAAFPADLAAVVELFRAYATSLPFSLEYQGFDKEVATLPGKYARPGGEVLIAWMGKQPVGCVALRPLPPHAGELEPKGGFCEMKRFFVSPAARGQGVGKALAQAIIDVAKAAGYGIMRLDTSADMHPAQHVYEAVGFKLAPRYNDDPDPTTVYYERSLA